MKKMIKYFIATTLLIMMTVTGFNQSSCASPYSIGTPTTTQSCQTLSNMSAGSSPCAGAGYGGSGGYVYINFCTNASNDCINFEFTDITTSGNWAYSIYDASCAYTGNGGCMGNSGTGANFNTANMTLAASTCYTVRVWVKGGPNTFQMCTETMPSPNDDCPNAIPIDGTPLSDDNFCTTPGPTLNSPTITPAMICAGSLENTAWYTFTVLADGDVIITIDNIVCSGGAAGFQIGYFSGVCGSLVNDGCTSGSGGTVTANYSGLTAGDVLYIAIDGNAGANCTYDISATNTVSLPIDLLYFDGGKYSDHNLLEWVSSSETNNDYYIIQTSSDGIVWTTLDMVPGAGNTTTPTKYEYKHEKPLDTINLYSLIQTDYNGLYENLGIIAIDNRIKSKVIRGKYDYMGQPIKPNHTGLVIIVYMDGTTKKYVTF